MISLSTVWNGTDTEDGHLIVAEAKKLGFDSIELHHSLKITTVKDILEERNSGSIKISSLHNHCPAVQPLKLGKPKAEPYSLCSLDTLERRSAIKRTLRTIEFAELFQASAVVLHCGWIEMKDVGAKLARMYHKNMQDTDRYCKIKGKFLQDREKKSGRYMERLFRTLDILNEEAHRRGIKLGIENRYYPMEVPDLEEIGIILEKFEGGSIYYWHDVGHGQNIEELGIATHLSYLERYREKLIGIHLHDIEGLDDHKVPLTGGFNFEKIVPYIAPDIIKVLEISVKTTEEELHRGINYIRSLFAVPD